MTSADGEAAFFQRFPVSRETLGALRDHVALLRTWQRRINLVGPATLPAIWDRHVFDSAQLLALAPQAARVWTDLGSGGGFPGLVLAVLLRREVRRPGAELHLVESDQRKAVFLRECARRLDLPVTVHARRIEELAGWPSDVVTARACAPADALLRHARPFVRLGTVALFPKGKGYAAELTALQKCGTFRCEAVRSATDPDARILRLEWTERPAEKEARTGPGEG